MKRHIALVAAFVCGCSNDPLRCPSSIASAEPLTTQLEQLAGRNAKDCGLVPIAMDQAGAVECARKMLKDKRPFRVAAELQGVDSYVWNGVAANEQGQLSYVFFDSDIRGSGCYNPRLTTNTCTTVTFPSGSSREFMCAKT